LIIGLANKLHLAEVLDYHMETHDLQQGLNNGQLALGWLASILSQADHRKSAVRDWANVMPHTLDDGQDMDMMIPVFCDFLHQF
jgi:hypothetical protein